jgi:hypothetical protein
MLSDSLK